MARRKTYTPDPHAMADAEAFGDEIAEYRAYINRPRPHRRRPRPPDPPEGRDREQVVPPNTQRVFHPERVFLLILMVTVFAVGFWLTA